MAGHQHHTAEDQLIVYHGKVLQKIMHTLFPQKNTRRICRSFKIRGYNYYWMLLSQTASGVCRVNISMTQAVPMARATR